MRTPQPFQVMLDFDTGSLTPCTESFERRLSGMAGAYEDQRAVADLLSAGEDPVIYTGYDADVPHAPDHLLFRTTIIRPGVIGSEFFMTKGHHHRRDTAEVYVGMSGSGLLIMETRDGDFASAELVPSAAVYVPPGWAHRTVNTANTPLAFLATYPGDAGHDYQSIERQGFSRRVHSRDGGYELRPADAAPDGGPRAAR